MKKLFFVCLLLSATTLTFAQAKFGLKAGLSTTDVTVNEIEFGDGSSLDLENVGVGFHAGIFFQAKMGAFFIQPEVLFNSNTATYRVNDFGNGLVDQAFSESYNYLDIPVLLGLKLGPVRLGAGPVGHVFLNSNTGLNQWEQYREDFRALELGYQAGIGLDIWKLVIDVRHEGNLGRFGNHINVGGETIAFDETPSRLLVSVGWAF